MTGLTRALLPAEGTGKMTCFGLTLTTVDYVLQATQTPQEEHPPGRAPGPSPQRASSPRSRQRRGRRACSLHERAGAGPGARALCAQARQRGWATRARWLLPVTVTTQTTSAGACAHRSSGFPPQRHFTERKARPRCKARG